MGVDPACQFGRCQAWPIKVIGQQGVGPSLEHRPSVSPAVSSPNTSLKDAEKVGAQAPAAPLPTGALHQGLPQGMCSKPSSQQDKMGS